MLIIKALISAIVIVAVAEIAGRMPRVGALLLTLPIVSIIAFVMTWGKDHDMNTIASLARETLILVPLGLPFFIPFAISNRTGLSFWPSFAFGDLLASLTIGTWFWISSPQANRQPEIENRQ
jgi:hypothetical protein